MNIQTDTKTHPYFTEMSKILINIFENEKNIFLYSQNDI